MTRDAWVQAFEQAPEQVQAYLLDPAAADRERAVQEKLGYEHDAWDRVMDIVWDILFAHIEPEEAAKRFKAVAGDRKPEDVERGVLFGLILPLADVVIWDVESRLQQLGMPLPEVMAVPRIVLRPVSYGAAVRRIASDAKISILSEEIARRLRDAFVSFLKGIRSDGQLMETLIKNQSEGGIGLTKDQANAFFTAMQRLLETTRVLSETEYATWYAAYQEQAQAQAEATQRVPAAAINDDDDMKVIAGPKHGSASLQAATDAVLKELPSVVSDPFAQKRLETIVSTRLRDVRNASQVRQVLSRDLKVGGLGLPPEQVNAVAAVIERAYEQHRDAITEEEKRSIEQVATQQKTTIEERRKRESEEHAQWYKDKVKMSQTSNDQAMAIFDAMKKGMQSGQMPAVAPAPVVPSNGRPSMDVVRAPGRLMGLTDELGGITVQTFRRLAKQPADAAERVWQKLSALEQESFDRWTQGIQAWRNSPMQQEYLRLVAESFGAGKPVAELVQERHAKDPNTLSPEEVNAMIQLNSRIQL